MSWWSAIIGFVKNVIFGSFVNKAIRKIAGGLQSAANAIASWLEEHEFYRAARTVRHFARFVLFLGKALVTANTVYGPVDTIMDLEQVVDDVEIEGERYSLVGPTYAS